MLGHLNVGFLRSHVACQRRLVTLQRRNIRLNRRDVASYSLCCSVNRSLLVRNRLLLSGLLLLLGLLLLGRLFVGIRYRLHCRNIGVEGTSGTRNGVLGLNCSLIVGNFELQLT